MNLKKHIPNLFTLGNLFCGLIAINFVFQNDFYTALVFVAIGILLDFFDGFLARILGVSAELGKQLDSLADAVTSGVVPGFTMFFMLLHSSQSPLSYIGLLLTLAAIYRLAKFNIDTRQSNSFIGLPTPAMSLFVVSLPVIYQNTTIEFVRFITTNNYFLIGITLVLSYLMNANLPLLALKFNNFKWKGNEFRYVLILISVNLLIITKFLAIPLIIIVYIFLSIIQNLTTQRQTK